MSTSLAWDDRYAGGGFQFGRAPNEYLRAQGWRLRPGSSALAVGDGEGRNGVWLAREGLAVTTLDWSATGVAKAREFAAAEGVALDARQADVARCDWSPAEHDLIAWIYLHLPPEDRTLAAWSRAVVEQEFAALEILELTEGAVRLDEGPRHQGLAEVVRAVLRKPVS